MKIKYLGASDIREVTKAQLEDQGVYDQQEDIHIDISVERNRIVEVSEKTAELLTSREPQDWHVLTKEEVKEMQDRDREEQEAKEAAQAEAEAERQAIAEATAAKEASASKTKTTTTKAKK